MSAQGKNTPWPWTVEHDGNVIAKHLTDEPKTYVVIADLNWDSSWSFPVEPVPNGDLIVAACNACMQVNPSNPVAAAEALPELLEACETMVAEHDAGTGTNPAEMTWDSLRDAIANAKREE